MPMTKEYEEKTDSSHHFPSDSVRSKQAADSSSHSVDVLPIAGTN